MGPQKQREVNEASVCVGWREVHQSGSFGLRETRKWETGTGSLYLSVYICEFVKFVMSCYK